MQAFETRLRGNGDAVEILPALKLRFDSDWTVKSETKLIGCLDTSSVDLPSE